MLPKFLASWLVVLVIMPFTAPFSTCDLMGLIGSAPGHHGPFGPPPATAVTNDVAVASVPFIFSSGRGKFVPLTGVPLAQSKVSSASASCVASRASTRCSRPHTVLTTILRL